MNELSTLLDRELVTLYKTSPHQTIVEELHKRYRNLFHKQWSILRKQLGNSIAVLELEDDFYAEMSLMIYQALDAIKLEKIRDDNWKFLGYLRFYVMSLRSKYINDLSKKVSHEDPLTISDSDGERELSRPDLQITDAHNQTNPELLFLDKEREVHVRKAVHTCFAQWDATKQFIFKKREQGITRTQIAKELSVTPAAITYHMDVMQRQLHSAIAHY